MVAAKEEEMNDEIVVTLEPHGALYVRFRRAHVARTVELVEDALYLDVDEYNNVLGIEALQSGTLRLTLQKIPKEYRLPEEFKRINLEALDKAFIPAMA